MEKLVDLSISYPVCIEKIDTCHSLLLTIRSFGNDHFVR